MTALQAARKRLEDFVMHELSLQAMDPERWSVKLRRLEDELVMAARREPTPF